MLHTPSRPARSQPFPIAVLPRPPTVDVLDGRSQIPIVPSCLDSPRSVLPSSCLPNRFQRKCDSPYWASLLSKGLALFYSEPVPRLASFLHSELLAVMQGGEYRSPATQFVALTESGFRVLQHSLEEG